MSALFLPLFFQAGATVPHPTHPYYTPTTPQIPVLNP